MSVGTEDDTPKTGDDGVERRGPGWTGGGGTGERSLTTTGVGSVYGPVTKSSCTGVSTTYTVHGPPVQGHFYSESKWGIDPWIITVELSELKTCTPGRKSKT